MYLAPNLVYALKGSTVRLSLKIDPESTYVSHLYIRLNIFFKLKFLKKCNVSQDRERSKHRKNQQFCINEHYLYLFNIYVHLCLKRTCSNIMSILLESMHTPFSFRLYCIHRHKNLSYVYDCIFKRFTDLLFLNEYMHMRKCVCLDTRLV